MVEEILKDINNYISFSNKSENFSDINEYLHCKELARRLQALLDLYEKEKEKNNQKYYHTITCNELEKEINKVWEDKIKKEIKELDNMKVDGEVFTTAVNFAKKTLQQLLEED